MNTPKLRIRFFCALVFAQLFLSEASAQSPTAVAGLDIVVADFDGDQEVTIKLNGSASSSPNGAIVSYSWSSVDGTVTGPTPEVVFPVRNGAITVTLTVKDVNNQSATDTLEISVYDKETALFTDFPSLALINATVASETLVVDSLVGSTRVYRRNGGGWGETPYIASNNDDIVVDADTVLGGSFYSGTDFSVSRFVGNEWVASPLTLSAPVMPANGFQLLEYAVDPSTVVVADRYNSLNGSQAGRVFVYDWVGENLNFSAEIDPPGGFAANDQWGTKVAVEGNLMAIASAAPTGSGSELHIYRKAAAWSLEATLSADPISPFFFSNSFTAFSISIGNGVILIAANNGSQIIVIEKIGPNWVQTPMVGSPFGLTQYFGYKMNNDGLSFVAHDESGRFVLYKKGSEASTWSGSSVTTRRLLTRDLTPTRDTKVTGFSNGLVALSDSILRKARVIDTNTSIDPINVEPIANAGDDIVTTSFDGGPVRLFLDGFGSRDLNYNSPLSAVWTWQGGSASGLQAYADIPPSVTSIELTITDSGGLISRDTIQVDIESPPVIDAGPDVTVVDTDGDGSIRLEVNGSVISQDNPIISWNWSWPGGTLNGQSGTITLDGATNGKTVTLTVLDENFLISRDEFVVRILDSAPSPDILQPVVGAPQDLFGNHVAIGNDTALISAPGFKVDGEPVGATFLSENINSRWQQLSLSPGSQQGSGVLIDGDTAFVGASNLSRENEGQVFNFAGGVYIYQRQSGSWNQTGLLTSPEEVNYTNSDYTTFGASMAKSGNWLAIGSPGANNPGAGRSGAVFLFEQVSGVWTFRQKIISPDAESFSAFGFAVAISGDSLVVTSDFYQGGYDSGVAHVFTKGASQWDVVQKLESDNTAPGANDGFGRSVAMNDTEIFIGADQESNGAISSSYSRGVIYRFSKNESSWLRTAKLVPAVAPPNDASSFFGTSLFLRDGILLASSPWDAGFSTASNTTIYGRVHIYELSGSNLAFVDHIDLDNSVDPLASYGTFGFSIAHDGRDLIVGAPSASNSIGLNTGKVYIFQDLAALDPDANYEPLANAGADINITDDGDIDDPLRVPPYRDPVTNELNEWPGSEEVTLDASLSTDQENAIVSYEWTWPDGSASGVTANVRFPVGTTVVTLTVTDDNGIVNSDTVNVTIALAQAPPAALPGSNNTLTVNLPVPGAKWRLSSEFLWHAIGESAGNIVLGQPYQLEVLGYPGSAETVTTLVTSDSSSFLANLTLILPIKPVTTGIVSFPETAQGFAWRLRGEPTWRDVSDDGDEFDELISATVATGELIIDYKPVTGYATPASQLVSIQSGQTLALNWNDYQSIDNFDPAKTFTAAVSPNLSGDPYQYVGMIRTPLGRGTGTVVAPRVVLTAAHLFFDSSGLQWADTQWFPRQQEGERQAPPITPRGILYQTAYAQIVAPDTVQNPVATVPADKKEADFAVLFFDSGNWDGGAANYLQSTTERNWLTGSENKQGVGYPQRSQPYELRGKIFGKNFATALSPVDSKPLPLIYETGELFGDGGASGSALFVQPQGVTGYYPAAILLAGQDRAVYRVIDQDVGRMIQDAKDAATGNDEVLDSNYSLVTYGAGGLRALEVDIETAEVLSTARWSVKPNSGTTYTNLTPSQRVGYSNSWANVTVSFSAVSGYITPPPITLLNSQVPPGGVTTISNIIYEPVSGFDLWKQSAGIASDNDDRDGDGRSALIEYAINGNPDSGTDPVPIRMAAVPLQSTHAEFEVYVSTTADKIRYVVKASNTLPPANVVTLATFTKADGANGYERVTDIQPKSASSRRFAWVEYTHDRNLPDPQ